MSTLYNEKLMEKLRSFGSLNEYLGKIKERMDDCFNINEEICPDKEEQFEELDNEKREYERLCQSKLDSIVEHLLFRKL